MFKIHELAKAARGRLALRGGRADIKGVSIDSRRIKKGEAFIAIKGDNFDGHDFIKAAVKKGAACIIAEREPGEIGKASFIKVKDTVRALGSIARFNRRRYDIPVIAVTGSTGKTTAKDMIACVLSKEFKVLSNEGTKNNHIGLPLTLLKLDKTYDMAVLEIGTNHFGEVRYLSSIASPNIGVITNIGPAHLQSFKSLRGVFREKYDLVSGLKSPAIAVLNADDRYLRQGLLKKKSKIFSIGVGIEKRSDFSASSIRHISGRHRFKVNRRLEFALTVPGYYNIYNSLLSVAVARVFGMEYWKISSALSGFKLPRGRLNIINKKGIRFIDDTYNSNPLSLAQALDLIKKIKVRGRKIAVMGDMLELGKESVRLHRKAIKESAGCCDTLIAVGKISSLSARGLAEKEGKIISCLNPLKARDILFNYLNVRPSDIVLVKGSRGMKMEEVFNF